MISLSLDHLTGVFLFSRSSTRGEIPHGPTTTDSITKRVSLSARSACPRLASPRMQMRGASVPPTPPNLSRTCSVLALQEMASKEHDLGLRPLFLPATAKLRPPQATEGTSHPRSVKMLWDVSQVNPKNTKYWGWINAPPQPVVVTHL